MPGYYAPIWAGDRPTCRRVWLTRPSTPMIWWYSLLDPMPDWSSCSHPPNRGQDEVGFGDPGSSRDQHVGRPSQQQPKGR